MEMDEIIWNWLPFLGSLKMITRYPRVGLLRHFKDIFVLFIRNSTCLLVIIFGSTLTTAFVPCLTFGQIAVVDNCTSSCATSRLFYGLIAAFIGIPFVMSCTYSTKLRSKYNLIESPAPDWVTHLSDWVTHLFCEPCALYQEFRQLQVRGIDPSIGWIGNVQRNPSLQQPKVNIMMPPMNQNMNQY